jgi:uncharacterized protein YutE (UPF0331/DUF86 family)
MERKRLRRYIDKIGHIEERIRDIRTWLIEFENIGVLDRKTRLAVYKAMQEAVEASTDIGAIILKDEGKLPQDDYTNIARLFTPGIIIKSSSMRIINPYPISPPGGFTLF